MLRPKFYFKKVSEIPKEFFVENKVKTVLLDLDGTLAPADTDSIDRETLDWINEIKSCELKLIIVSNNSRERVKRFAIKVRLPFFSKVGKPMGKLLRKIKKRELDNICMIGDQIFTDVLGGNLVGITTILVNPIEVGKQPIKTRIMRFFEKPFRKERRV